MNPDPREPELPLPAPLRPDRSGRESRGGPESAPSTPPGGARWPVVTLVAALLVLLPAPFPGLAGVLAYDRQAILLGEAWRLWTGHLVHWTGEHLFWNVVALVGLGVILEPHRRRPLAATLRLASPLASLGLLRLVPRVSCYRGLSGLDSALVALLAVSILRSGADRLAGWFAAAGLLLFVAKVLLETFLGTPLFARGGAFEALPEVHRLGAVLGAQAAGLANGGLARRRRAAGAVGLRGARPAGMG